MLNIDELRSQFFKISENEEGNTCCLTKFDHEDSRSSVRLKYDPKSGVLSDDYGLYDVLRGYVDLNDYEDYLVKTAPEFGVRYEKGLLVAEEKNFDEAFNDIVQASVILSARIIEQEKIKKENEPILLYSEEDL